MSEIGNLEILDEDRVFDFPAIILDVAFAKKALEQKELPFFIDQAIKALDLSGQRVAILREEQ